MKKIFFLVNNMNEYIFQNSIDKYLRGIRVCVGEALPRHPEEYDLIILWSYQKILKESEIRDNFILFHSSDLPKGKGWAPIYYTLKNKEEFYTITGLKVANKVDSGDIFIKARFKVRDNYTAEHLRMLDTNITIYLIKKTIDEYPDGVLSFKKQIGEESYYIKRNPEDNEINLQEKFYEIIPHLRACEKKHPAFFYLNETRYNIYIEPENLPFRKENQDFFPEDLEILFFD